MENIEKFLSFNGFNLGLGIANGKGRGDGGGYGDGYGGDRGHGYANGFYGTCKGIGNGDGNGKGCGYGYSYKYGNGIAKFDGHEVYYIDNVPTCLTSVHGNYAKGFFIKDNSVKVPRAGMAGTSLLVMARR